MSRFEHVRNAESAMAIFLSPIRTVNANSPLVGSVIKFHDDDDDVDDDDDDGDCAGQRFDARCRD